ncbi:hypothetical protein GCM10029992_29950 [Glycomyces albus]
MVLGRVELEAAPELGDLPGEQAPASGGELLGLPGLVEVGQGEGASGLVGDDDLGELPPLRPPASAGLARQVAGGGGPDLGDDGGLLADLERAQVGLLAAPGVAERVVAQQIADGLKAQPLVERGGGLGAHHVPQPGLQLDGHSAPIRISGSSCPAGSCWISTSGHALST